MALPSSVPAARVLVIEDDPWVTNVLSELLADEGHEVLTAAHGESGLLMAEEHQPAVILLDLALPDISGLDILKTLRERHSTRDVPVIVLSAYGLLVSPEDRLLADAVVQKPFDIGDLATTVADLVGGRPHIANLH